MKKLLLLMMLIGSIGLLESCNSEPAKKPSSTKKEVVKNNTKKNKPAKANKNSGYTWKKFWNIAERRYKLTPNQLAQLKAAKKTFDNNVKSLGNNKNKAAVDKYRATYYNSIKKILGKDKGQEFINFRRRYKKKM